MSQVKIATNRLINSVWTLEYRLHDNKIEIVSHSRDNRAGAEFEGQVPKYTLIEDEKRTVTHVRLWMDSHRKSQHLEFPVSNPAYVFSYKYHKDGEVLGLDTDGCILQWDSTKGEVYNGGETPAMFGLCNMTAAERERLPKCSDRKFHRQVIQIEIVSEEDLSNPCITLEELDQMSREGGCFLRIDTNTNKEIDARACVMALNAHGSSPELFKLDAIGRDIE